MIFIFAKLQLRGSQYRYLLIHGGNLLREIHTHIQNRTWRIAAIRLHDLADQCSQLAHFWQNIDTQWQTFVTIALWWGDKFNNGQTNRPFEYDSNSWCQFQVGVQSHVRSKSQLQLRVLSA